MAETFELNDIEQAHANEWIEQHNRDEPVSYTGAIGGRYVFEFIPTSINVVKSVRCSVCGASEHLTEIPAMIPAYDELRWSPGFRLPPGDAGRWRRAVDAARERRGMLVTKAGSARANALDLGTADLKAYADLLYREAVALQSTDSPEIADFCLKRIDVLNAESDRVKAELDRRQEQLGR